MKRSFAAGFVGVIALTTLLVAPAAQAAGTRSGSTSCDLTMMMKFQPAMVHGANPRTFIKLRPHVSGCTGGTVTGATGYGGSLGDLRCDSGRVSGRAGAKAMLFWDTGDTSGLNFFIDFSRSKLVQGLVTDGLFKGEQFKVRFDFTPLVGDCEATDLLRASATGALGL